MIIRTVGFLSFLGSVAIGLFIAYSLLLVIYTSGYMDGTVKCDAAALKR